MIEKFKKILKQDKIVFFLIFIAIIFISHLNEGLWKFGDDIYFKDAIDNVGNGNLNSYLVNRYQTWTGRVIVETIMVSIINHEMLWRILNSLMIFLLVYSIYKFTINKDSDKNSYVKVSRLLSIFIFFNIFLIDRDVYKWSISWVTGSFNYLWPMALGIFSLIPFKQAIFNETYNKKIYILYFLATIVACNVEQVAAFTICFATIANIWNYTTYKKINIILIAHNLFMIANALFLFMAPGNIIRYNAEILNWFPDFETLTNIEKIYRGIVLLISHLFESYIVVITVICVLLVVLIFNKYKDKFIRFISILPLTCISIYYSSIKNVISPIRVLMTEYDHLINFNIRTYFSIGMFLGVLIIIPYLIYLSLDGLEKKIITIILYFAAICCALAISFSPTIYASGSRVFFCTDIIFLIIMNILVKEILIRGDIYIRGLANCIMFILLAVSFGNYIVFILDK